MGSLGPSDSASRVSFTGVSLPTSIRSPGDDVVAIVEALKGIPGLRSEHVQTVLKSWSGAYHAYLRKVGEQAGSSTQSSSVVERSSLSSAVQSCESISAGSGVSSDTPVSSRIAHWRRTGRMACSPSRAGYCYLMAIRHEARERVSEKLLRAPTFASILTLPVRDVVPMASLADLHVQRGKRRCHLRAAAGEGTVTLQAALAEAARGVQYEIGTLGAAVATVRPSSVGLDLSYTLGYPASLMQYLKEVIDLPVSTTEADREVSLLTKSAALHDAGAKARLRMFEAVGDAALTHVLSRKCLELGKTVQQYQAARSACTNNAALSRLFVTELPVDLFHFPADVPVGTGATGAKTLEAVIGFVDVHFGFQAAEQLIHALNVLQLAGQDYGAVVLRDRLGARDGYCYMAAVRVGREASARLMGENPTFRQLMDLGEDDLKPVMDLAALSVVRVEKEAYPQQLADQGRAAFHLCRSSVGVPFMTIMSILAKGHPDWVVPRTLGSLAISWPYRMQMVNDEYSQMRIGDRLGSESGSGGADLRARSVVEIPLQRLRDIYCLVSGFGSSTVARFYGSDGVEMGVLPVGVTPPFDALVSCLGRSIAGYPGLVAAMLPPDGAGPVGSGVRLVTSPGDLARWEIAEKNYGGTIARHGLARLIAQA